MSLLVAQNLSIGYKKKILHQNLCLEIPKSQFVCLIGANGVGKTTLLQTLSALLPPISGTIFWLNQEINQISFAKKAHLLSLVLTQRNEDPLLSVEETLRLGRYPYTNWWGKLEKKDLQKIEEALEWGKLSPLRHKKLTQISDGERQKTLIARALVQDTPLIFLDEATAHLDLANRILVFRLLKDLAQNFGKGILFSTHELDLALQFADRLCLLSPQKMVVGLPEQMVLDGELDTLFDGLRFNAWQAHFEFLEDQKMPISVLGEGLLKIWTEKALHRIGFRIQDNAEHQLQIFENKWGFHGQIFENLNEVLAFFQKNSLFLRKLTP